MLRKLGGFLGIKYTVADSDARGIDPSMVSSWKASAAEGEDSGAGNFSFGNLPNA